MVSKVNPLLLSAAILVLIGSGACQQDRVFEEYRALADYKWPYTDTISYTVPIQDTGKRYNLAVNLRNKINYPYRNIWVLVQHRAPSGKVSSIKAEFELARKNGEWKGRGLGDLYDHRFPVQKKMQLSEAGDHQFRVVHLMRTDTLPGVMNVGLRITRPQS